MSNHSVVITGGGGYLGHRAPGFLHPSKDGTFYKKWFLRYLPNTPRPRWHGSVHYDSTFNNCQRETSTINRNHIRILCNDSGGLLVLDWYQNFDCSIDISFQTSVPVPKRFLNQITERRLGSLSTCMGYQRETYWLGCALNEKGVKVTLFDIWKPIDNFPKEITFLQGDVRSYSDVEDALKNANCVFHIASYGMSGREQLNRKLIEEVNVTGTENVIQACLKNGVPRLVYTSTFNVVFGGQVIKNGDETLPYLPLHLHPDYYSKTKSIAEMAVLKANGLKLENGSDILRTCALRPAGIYGPGEQRHLPRIVSYIERGIFKFVYGDVNSLVEFVHVNNLVAAHIMAADALTAEKKYRAAGQPYFISDGKPVNNFEFFRPLVEGLGYRFPTVRLPISLIYFFAFLTEMFHFLIGPVYNFQPLLTRTEVYKTGVTHYFSLEKAKQDLGYKPQSYNLDEVVEWFKLKGHGKKSCPKSFTNAIWNVLLIMVLTFIVLCYIPVVGI